MVTAIALLVPAVLSVWAWEAVSKSSISNKKWVYLYSLNVTLINLVCFAIKRWIRHTGENSIADMSPSAAINYIVVAVIVAIVLTLVEVFLYKRVRIQIESGSESVEDAENE